MREKMWTVTSDLQRDEVIFEIQRPCDCGCDNRYGQDGAGYILASAGRKQGCTVWIENEEVFRELEEAFKKARK